MRVRVRSMIRLCIKPRPSQIKREDRPDQIKQDATKPDQGPRPKTKISNEYINKTKTHADDACTWQTKQKQSKARQDGKTRNSRVR